MIPLGANGGDFVAQRVLHFFLGIQSYGHFLVGTLAGLQQLLLRLTRAVLRLVQL